MATERQLKILNSIVDIYVRTGEPVSSSTVLEKSSELQISSATARNEMVQLEEEGYITKLDSSSSRTSGRIPTTLGYQHYLKHIKTNPNSILSVKKKLDKILNNRKESIDKILKEAMKVINESTNTLTISNDALDQENKLLDINVYSKNDETAIVIIVTSQGNVINKEVNLNGIKYSDFEKVIKTYSKRLKDTKISELDNSLESLQEIIKIQVEGQEEKFQDMIKVLFSTITYNRKNYSGMNSLITATNLDLEKQVKVIFQMIEDNSIWDLISEEGSIETTTSGITVDMDFIDGVSVVKKNINLKDKNKQLTILGSKNQNYEKLFSMLDYLDKMIGGK